MLHYYDYHYRDEYHRAVPSALSNSDRTDRDQRSTEKRVSELKGKSFHSQPRRVSSRRLSLSLSIFHFEARAHRGIPVLVILVILVKCDRWLWQDVLKGLPHATVLYCTVLWVSFEMMVYSIRVLLRTRYQVAVATEVSRRLFVCFSGGKGARADCGEAAEPQGELFCCDSVALCNRCHIYRDFFVQMPSDVSSMHRK